MQEIQQADDAMARIILQLQRRINGEKNLVNELEVVSARAIREKMPDETYQEARRRIEAAEGRLIYLYEAMENIEKYLQEKS